MCNGNPIDNSGSLVTYYYGYDIINMIEENTKFKVENFFREDELLEYGILGKYKDVFYAQNKNKIIKIYTV